MKFSNLHSLTYSIFLYASLLGKTGAVDCGIGWTMYKDEACVKLFLDQLDTWENAHLFCASTASSNLEPSLPIIMELDYQQFILNEVIVKEDLYDNIWLGLKFEETENGFYWPDGMGINYANWAPGFPRQINDTDRYDVSCRKRNLVVCQKKPSWTIDEISKELVKLRKQIIPVGFIYTQPPFGQPPSELWPALKWLDISSEANGLFFRITGGGAAAWGTVQGDCAPRINHAEAHWAHTPAWDVGVPRSGWSGWLSSGYYGTQLYTATSLRFQSQDCEVRPRNVAVKLWKRVD